MQTFVAVVGVIGGGIVVYAFVAIVAVVRVGDVVQAFVAVVGVVVRRQLIAHPAQRLTQHGATQRLP